MYAQLCKRLSEEAPNFEPTNAGQNSINTFRQLLLSKCRVEFENRTAAQDVFDSRDGPLTPEEEEQRQIAKRKMLGNIKFIGELGKLGMLQGSILHRCCQQLLEKKRRGGVREMAEDLECLCQIMKTCGRILDTEKAKPLMDQYFDRMANLAYNMDLPSRIRFMLQDAIDLRRNQWQPRKIASSEGPRTIQQIREEAARDIGVYFPQPGSMTSRNSDMVPPDLKPAFWAGGRSEAGTGFEDMFSSVPLSAVSIGTGPGVIPSLQDNFGYDSDSSLGSFNVGYGGGGGGHPSYRGRHSYGNGGNNHYANRSNGGANNKQFSAQNQNQQNVNTANNAKNDLPPRFKKMMLSQQRNQNSSEEVSLRPSANSMVLKPKTTTAAKPAVEPNAGLLGPFLEPPFFAVPKPAQGVPYVGTAIVEKPRSTKSKGPTKDEVLKKAESVLEELLNKGAMEQAVQSMKEAKLPERFWPEILAHLMRKVLDKGDGERESVSCLLAALKKEGCVSAGHVLEGMKEILQQLSNLEAEVPRAKSFVAGFCARAIKDELMTLAEIAAPLEGGQHFPLFLLTLQQLHKLQGKAVLTQLFNESKVNLLNMLPELDRNKDRLAEILEDRGLSFLYPLLRIQADLWKQLQADPTPAQFYKWIKENLDSSYYTVPGFVSALFTVLLKYIVQETTGDASVDISAACAAPDKAALEKEKDLVKRYTSVLQAFLNDQVKLQVTALYALQAFCDSINWPKGMLLRWFVLLYDLEIIEEEAFLKWKEDLSDDTPGKGKALFQVHNWLTWLEQADSDEDDDGDA